jgi:tetratricopeptide (TPR) repeat protein
VRRWGDVGGLAALVVALALGCGPRGVKPDLASREWHELRSESFRLITDLDLDSARSHSRELEQLRWAVIDNYELILGKLAPPTQQFHIVHFSSCRDFREAAGKNVGGYVTRTPDFQRDRLMVTCDASSSDTFTHELIHVINAAVFARLPLWLNEGLATYYETMRVRDGQVRIGDLPAAYQGTWRQAGFHLSVDKLRAADPETFYDLERRRRNYTSAWKLVHMLNSQSPEYHQRFRRYLTALARGTGDDKSWQAAFGDLPTGELDRHHRYYQNRTHLRYYRSSYQYRSDVAVPEVRALRPGEVHAVWVMLQLAGKEAGDKAAARHLELMTSDDPEWTGALFWRAVIRARQGARDESALLLRRYLEREPDDRRGWHALVSLLLPESIGLEDEPPASLERLRPEIMELVRVGHTAAELNLIAWYFALSHKPAVGLNFARRALKAAPSCASCLDTLALIHYRAGDPARALAAQERAITMMGDIAPSSGAIRRLEAFRKTAAAASAPAADETEPELLDRR